LGFIKGNYHSGGLDGSKRGNQKREWKPEETKRRRDVVEANGPGGARVFVTFYVFTFYLAPRPYFWTNTLSNCIYPDGLG